VHAVECNYLVEYRCTLVELLL